jgi:hypothetical protein
MPYRQFSSSPIITTWDALSNRVVVSLIESYTFQTEFSLTRIELQGAMTILLPSITTLFAVPECITINCSTPSFQIASLPVTNGRANPSPTFQFSPMSIPFIDFPVGVYGVKGGVQFSMLVFGSSIEFPAGSSVTNYNMNLVYYGWADS